MNLSVTASSLRERIDEILPRVARPARYMGGELNSVRKPPEEVSARIALAFPDVYEVGMSNLGLRILYHVVNSRPGAAAERVFAPAPDMEAEMRSAGIPLFSLESSLPVRDFDLVGFSLAYEMAYTTVLDMLDLAQIPLFARDRTEADPIVIAGGHCTTNPEPMAEFIDAFAIGDGEDVILDILSACEAHRGDRAAALAALAGVDGVYVPSVHRAQDPRPVIHGRAVADLENAPFPTALVVPFTETVHDRVAVEIMRGCSRGCRFCQAGMITRPVRERSLATLCEQADTLLENTGYEEVALTSLSSADHSQIEDIVRTMIDCHEAERVGVSLPSLRADARCVQLAAQIQRVRKSGLTLAPEAGTQRLRDVINKNVTEEDLLGAIEAAVECGWKRVKLYFMVGLPTETDDDLRGIGELANRVIEIGRRHRVALTVSVTISPFVPKPHTPFQWRGMVGLEELDRRISVIRPLLKSKQISLSWHDPRCSRIEAALARGDRRLSRVINEVWRAGGKLEQDSFDNERWLAAFDAEGLDVADYANADIPRDAALPWDHIDVGVTGEFLAREDAKADSGETTEDCRWSACSACGVRQALARMCGGAVTCPPAPPSTQLDVRERADGAPQPEDRRPHSIPVLFTFRKGEQMRWLGHLDLMRVFERAVRMSGIDVAFTEGFNPHAKMSVASALPLGATADREILVVHFSSAPDLKDVLKRLNGRLPEGLSLVDARVLPENRRKPVVTASEFVVSIEMPDAASAGRLGEAVEMLLREAEVLCTRRSDGRGKTVDIRPGIERLSVSGGPDGVGRRIVMRLPHREFTVKPSEVVEAIGRYLPGIKLVSIHRTSLVSDALDT